MKRDPEWVSRAVGLLENRGPQAYTKKALAEFLGDNWDELGVPANMSVRTMIKKLLDTSQLVEQLISPVPSAVNRQNEPYAGMNRFLWGKPSPHSVAMSLRAGGYFSHASAIFLHGLTTENPKTIYINKEQSQKTKPTAITSQAAIDKAFSSNPRVSKYVFEYDGYRIVLLNGKSSGNLEVSEIQIATGEYYPVTKLERTLIDAIVRPSYAGGIYHVRDAFLAAKDRISINVLTTTLQKLDYVYPYHQAIGFLLESVGVPPEKLRRLKELGLDYDFYLVNKMTAPQYDASWRIYHPEAL